MTAPQMIARSYHAHSHKEPIDQLLLDYDARFLRRKVLVTTNGKRLLVDLPKTTSLDHNSVLITEEGGEVQIKAAPEPLLEVRAKDLTRVAWHVGNRHTPCQIETDRLLIQRDPVIKHMLEHLGASVVEVDEPFTPEGGAYGHGRTHSHEHGHTAHDHGHSHAH